MRAVRILDRYMLREFLLPWLYSFDAMVTLVVTVIMLDRIDEFMHGQATGAQILLYCLNILPEIFVILLPLSLLLGALFCLSSLGKHGEIQAMRASGLSAARLALPLLWVGLLASVGTYFLSEHWAIRAKERAESFIEQMRGAKASHDLKNFFYTNEQDHRSWQAASFNTETKEMLSVTINQANPDSSAMLDIFAERAVWRQGTWRLHGVSIFDYRETNVPNIRVAETNIAFLTELPQRLAIEAKIPDQLLAKELRRHVRSLHRAQRHEKAIPYAVELHFRYAFPFTCFIVVWLAVPLGMQVSRRGPMLGVGLALVLVVTFFFVTYIASALGNQGTISPPLAAWLPNLLYGTIGAVLFWRSR